ncbi:helix-turn-helix domain-containing protein, partial [Pseudomonas aeruginosa]|uniref:helix-turn-helix domain-containing protein n=1 Tax=Pseudomonas aeruginosa TaxID=287 RepID=UPI0021755A60
MCLPTSLRTGVLGKSSLTAYEAGRSDPTGDTIVKLAKALGVTTDELLLTDQERT